MIPPEELASLQESLKTNTKFRNEMECCPACGQNVMDRKVTLYKGLINSLYQVYRWCGEHKTHEFTMKDIRHILSQVDYTRFGDLVRFGGIVYKLGKARYGMNMGRAKEFFAGQRKIPVQITLNQLTNEIIDAKYVEVKEFPELSALLTAEGLYDYEKVI